MAFKRSFAIFNSAMAFILSLFVAVNIVSKDRDRTAVGDEVFLVWEDGLRNVSESRLSLSVSMEEEDVAKRDFDSEDVVLDADLDSCSNFFCSDVDFLRAIIEKCEYY